MEKIYCVSPKSKETINRLNYHYGYLRNIDVEYVQILEQDFVGTYQNVRNFVDRLHNDLADVPKRPCYYNAFIYVSVRNVNEAMMLAELIEVKKDMFPEKDVIIDVDFVVQKKYKETLHY